MGPHRKCVECRQTFYLHTTREVLFKVYCDDCLKVVKPREKL